MGWGICLACVWHCTISCHAFMRYCLLRLQNRSTAAGSDPVIWYCFSAAHVPRPEDFPVSVIGWVCLSV